MFNAIVAPNIRRIMKSKCMKQSLVAAKAGYTPQKFSNMLNGRKIIKDEDMLRIAETLDVEVGELFGKEGEDETGNQHHGSYLHGDGSGRSEQDGAEEGRNRLPDQRNPD